MKISLYFYAVKKSKIIRASIDDLEKLQILGRQCFKEAYEPVENPVAFEQYLDKAFSENQLLSELEHPESEFYFIQEGAELAGFIKINTGTAQSEKMTEEYLELERIYLLQKHYGKGLGRVLIDKVVEKTRAKKKKKIWLGVWEENLKAISFYKHLGFKVIGEHTFMLGDLPEVDLMMELEV